MVCKHNFRSISFPSTSNPITLRIEVELNKLKIWEASLTTRSSGSICIGLSGLEELYKCVDRDLLDMGSTQEVLSRHRNEKCLDELLEGSVKLLDVCSIARDLMSRFKEQVQSLRSAHRRRKLGASRNERNLANYSCFRKKMIKDATKLIAVLKQMDKIGASTFLDQDQHLSAVIRVVREVNVMNSSIFQSLLLFLSTPVSKQKQSKWSLVSKLMHKGIIASEEDFNELERVDSALREAHDMEKIQIAQKKLEALEIRMEEIENCLESVFRVLIKTRASILNIISQ